MGGRGRGEKEAGGGRKAEGEGRKKGREGEGEGGKTSCTSTLSWECLVCSQVSHQVQNCLITWL